MFQVLEPVIGTDAITVAFYLSEDTLGDAVGAANAAAASAAAALTSKNAAATSATNAGTSASAASGSATAASGSASTAATSATNAGNSASAASGSASSASTSATNAGTSATAAAGSATAASGSATAAATSATNAGTSATSAAMSASAAATSVAALGYTFSTTTTDADPGNGTLRLNNASAALATAAYVDNLDAGGATVSGMLDTFDDSTNTIKGQLTLRSKASAAISYVYNVTGSVMDGTGYRKLTLAFVNGAGTLPTTANGIWLMFDRAGDKGADGAGTGDFVGPASSVADNIVTFAGTTGKVGKDSGVKVTDLQAAINAKMDAVARLGAVAQTITDWNSALDNGWYMGNAAANAPEGINWFLGNVEAHGSTGWRTQTVHQFNADSASDPKVWRRAQDNGSWGIWYKLQLSQAEQDARYMLLANKATVAQIRAATTDKIVTSDGMLAAMGWSTITYAAAISVNHADGVNQRVTLAGNGAFAAPANVKVGWPLNIWVIQDATGGRIPTWNATYDFGDASAPTGSTGAGQADIYTFIALAADKFVFLGVRRRVD